MVTDREKWTGKEDKRNTIELIFSLLKWWVEEGAINTKYCLLIAFN